MRHKRREISTSTLLKFQVMKSPFLFLGLMTLSVAQAAAQTKPISNAVGTAPRLEVPSVPVVSARTGPAVAPAGIGPIAQNAAQAGVRRCLPRIDQVVNFLSTGAQTGAMVFTSPNDADNRQLSVSLEVLGSNGLSYIDTGYAPSSAGCDAMYQSVTYWTNSCDEVAKSAFPNFLKTNPIRQHIAVLDGGPSAKVFLMPAGAGCVSIKKEVVF